MELRQTVNRFELYYCFVLYICSVLKIVVHEGGKEGKAKESETGRE